MADRFANEPLAVESLPQLDDDRFVAVDPRHVWATLIGIATALLVAVGVTVLWAANAEVVAVPIVLGSLAGVGLAVAAVMSWLGGRRRAYQLREHDLSMRSGVVTVAVETIPFSRVQHVSVGRGAIERVLGLATLTVSSAGPDIAVPGLTPSEAERIKQLVAARAGVDDDPAGAVESAPSPLPPPPAPAP